MPANGRWDLIRRLKVNTRRVGEIQSMSGSFREEKISCCDRASNEGFLVVQPTDSHGIHMLHNIYLRVIGLLDPEDEDAIIYRSSVNNLAMSWNILLLLLLFNIIQYCYSIINIT